MTANGARRTTDGTPAGLLSATVHDEVGGPRSHANTLGLAAVPESVKAARDFARARLGDWGLAAMYDDVGLVVSELVTNALRYASLPGDLARETPFQLGLLHTGGWLTCAVTDPSDQAPLRRKPDFVSQTGRGLNLVEAFSDTWSWMPLHDQGKIVWACFQI